jgi:MtN3 and saliva related transmembrane protein
MDLPLIEVLGLIAGTVTSMGYLPQLYRGYKTKKLDDVSYFMPIVLAIGMTLWFFYGIILNAFAVIVANTFGITCSIILICMKKRYS